MAWFLIHKVWIVVWWMAPWRFRVPSTLRTGSGFKGLHKVRLCFIAKAWSMMIPSAPLSSRTLVLISFPDLCPTRVTLKTMEGDCIFQIVSPGTGAESLVSNKEAFTWEQGTEREPIDSVAIGETKNPQGLGLRRDASVVCQCRHRGTGRRCGNWSYLHHPRGLPLGW